MRILSIGLVAAVSLGLGGCAYNGLGMGVGTGYGYDQYGYGQYGYGNDRYAYGGYNPYGYDRYAYGGYNPYGYNAYGSPFGWYNGYYYPGSGGWVYDRNGGRRAIRRDEQAHFGRLREVFQQAVKNRATSGTTSSATNMPSRTTVTTTDRVRAPARTRGVERRERASPRAERSTSRSSRIVRERRNRDED